MAGRRGARGVVTLDDVCLGYESDAGDTIAVQSATFEVSDGERVLILGPSGCGKSTILRAVGGFLKPQHGRITVNGADVVRPGPDRLFVFQEFDQLMPWKTVLSNVKFALTSTKTARGAEADQRAAAAVETVGLVGFEDSFPHQLSGGMKQRVAIARALALLPPVLLMDEPFAALDAQTRQEMQEELLRVHAQMNTTLLFVTHSISEAILLANRILVMSRGPRSTILEVFDSPGEGMGYQDTPEYADLAARIRRTLDTAKGVAA